MKLRTRLFIWVGALFLVASIVSYFLEGRLVSRHLRESEDNIRQQILSLGEVRRENIEQYLAISLAEVEAQIDSLLQKIAEYPIIREGFSPTEFNINYGTWLHSATLMLNNKWIDYVQNILDNQLSSMIIADLQTTTGIEIEPINSDVALAIVTEDSHLPKGPYFAVRFFIDQFVLNQPRLYGKYAHLEEILPPMWLLFTPEAVEKFSVNQPFPEITGENEPLVPFWHWPGIPARKALYAEFLKEMKASKEYLSRNPSIKTDPEMWSKRIHAQSKNVSKKRPPYLEVMPKAQDRALYSSVMSKRVFDRFLNISNRIDELSLIWGLSAVYSMGPFGFSPFDSDGPIGVGRTLVGENRGKSMLIKETFFKKPFFTRFGCDQDYPKNKKLCLSRMISTISAPELNRFFFANTVRFSGGQPDKSEHNGYLTIGKDGGQLLQNLALATHQTALFVADNKALMAYNPDGDKILKGPFIDLNMEGLVGKRSGLISIGGEDYFFLHMQPFKKGDFHFYIFNEKSKEFALVDSLDKNANELINTISINMRFIALGALLIVLLILSNISRRITKPITILAKAAKRVGEGELDNIELPKVKEGRRDEIYQLSHSFHEMIQGLKEKEKVRGVLNKVVSSDIAEEILKGNVHLGGEEKMVTVLFADIRNFTQITEKMPPHDVVSMLNECMTKISRFVDEHGGVIDKYVGDEVMALFGAPVTKNDSPLEAIKAALEMLDALNIWNKARKIENLPPIEMGIGVHTGKVLAGNMGAENRLNYTVLGANVNLASRLCSKAGPQEVLISKSTLEMPGVKERLTVEEKSPIELKGFTDSIVLYKVTGIR